MSVKVFDLALSTPHGAYRPQDLSGLSAWEGGFDLAPLIGRIAYAELAGLAIFTRRENGNEKLFLMLMMRGQPRPGLVDSTRIDFHNFPVSHAPTDLEKMRLLGRHLCRKATNVIIDGGTLDFLKSQPPQLFEQEILALTTAFGRLLVPHAARAPTSVIGGVPRVEAPSATTASPPPVTTASQPPVVAASQPPDSPRIEDEQIIPLAPIDDEPTGQGESHGTGDGDLYQGDGLYPGDPESGMAAPPVNPYANPDAKPTTGSSTSGEQLSLPALLSSLMYPLRGSALVALLLLTIAPVVTANVALGLGCFAMVALSLLFAMVTASVVFEIIRQTAGGADSLEGSPDFGALGARFFELLATWILGIIPAALAAFATYSLLSLDVASGGLIAVGPVILAVDLVCFCLWLMALGATAVYEDWSFTVRVDLHLRALVKCWKSILFFMLRVFVLVVIGALLIAVAGSLMGSAIVLTAFLVGPFLMLASAHFIGLLFRQNEAVLETVYLYK